LITAGQSVGNYRILNKIGTGGMGAVYLAEHPLIGKRVALKVIHRELAGNRDVVQRFFQEARAVNKIGNDHIVEIHDFGQTPEGDHFFIMEYLEGQTLASVLSREVKIDVMRSLHVGAQIASALAAAHAAGIIHRDLKPDNIMLMAKLGDADFVKVLDFGLAKMFSAETAVKTAAGVLLGTPQYMSPEACESKGDVDHRTDIYALGVLLFQMLTGLLPFDGESMGEVLVKQVTMLPPAPRGVNPAIPPSVEQILLRCLAKRVDARFGTMMQLREALLDPEAYLHSAPPIVPARAVQLGDAGTMMGTVAHPVAAQPQNARIATEGHPVAAHQQHARIAGDVPAHQQNNRIAAEGHVPAHQQHTRIATEGHHVPAHQQNTRIVGDVPAHQQNNRIAAEARQVPAHQQNTRLVLEPHQVPAPFGGPAAAATLIAEQRPPVVLRRATTGMPALAPPQEPQMNTMRIATPHGYSSRPPPRRVWPVVFAIAVLLGIVGGLLVARPGRTSVATGSGSAGAAAAADVVDRGSGDQAAIAGGTSAVASAGSNAALPVGSTVASSVATPGAGRGPGPSGAGSNRAAAATGGTTRPLATPPVAHLSIDSLPPHAMVIGPDGGLLGKTPLSIEWPISDSPVTFELVLVGYKKKQKRTVISGNTALHIELERAPVTRRSGGGRASGSAKPGSLDNGLMNPN
jgi:tRNA A-37 threonylcarbamoyl transferase component Bud32